MIFQYPTVDLTVRLRSDSKEANIIDEPEIIPTWISCRYSSGHKVSLPPVAQPIWLYSIVEINDFEMNHQLLENNSKFPNG